MKELYLHFLRLAYCWSIYANSEIVVVGRQNKVAGSEFGRIMRSRRPELWE